MEYTNIKLEKEGAVATISLNRPDAMNALSPALLEDLSRAVANVQDDQSIKALVIRGEGRAFSAGADLVYFQTAFARPDLLTPYLQQFNDCLFQLESLPVPVIAVVHGFALAGGLELMLACDMALAADDARIGDQHVNFGLMPGGGVYSKTAPENRHAARHGPADHRPLAVRAARLRSGGWCCGRRQPKTSTRNWKSCSRPCAPKAGRGLVGSSRSPVAGKTFRCGRESPTKSWLSPSTWPPLPTHPKASRHSKKNASPSSDPSRATTPGPAAPTGQWGR